MKNLSEKIVNNRKLENAKILRGLLQKERMKYNQKIIAKWTQPEKYISKRKVEYINYRKIVKNKSQDQIKIRENKTNADNTTFYEYFAY